MKKIYQAPVSEIQEISTVKSFALIISGTSGDFGGGDIGDGTGDDFFPDPSANGSGWFEEADPFFDN